MHESHLIEPVLKGITEHAQKERARAVTKVRLKVGDWLGADDTALREAFALQAAGTLLEGAELEIKRFPGSSVQVISFDVE